MKVLKAKNKIKDSDFYFINDLFSLPNRKDKNFLEYQEKIFKDISLNGMTNPIIITLKKYYWSKLSWKYENKYGIVCGSKRYRYALENNYDKIEAVLVKSKLEYINLWKKTLYIVK